MTAVRRAQDAWEAGRCDPVSFDDDVDRSRRAFDRLAGCDVGNVALVGQVSTPTGLVASCLPDGANVLCAEEDFTSLDLDDLATASRDAQAQTYVGLHDRGPVGGLDGAPSRRLVCGRRPVAVDLRAAVAPGHGRPPLQRLTAEVVRSLGR